MNAINTSLNTTSAQAFSKTAQTTTANRQSAAGSALPVTIGAAGADLNSLGSPSTIVTFSEPTTTRKLTYTLPDLEQAGASPLLWDNSSDDPVNAVMARVMLASGTSGQYAGLGAALLNRFDTSGSNFSQAVAIDPAQLGITSATALSRQPSQIGLSIKTASGIKVELALTQNNSTLAVQVTSSGTLSDDERAALAKLANAFQAAIDGMTADKPKIAIEGLTQFDPALLASVDLTVSAPTEAGEPQTLSFHVDSKQRTLDLRLPSGTISMSTDLTNPALWGNQEKHDKAITSYLQRFDAAERRGHGDATLAGLFKDAFVQVNGGYAPASTDSVTKAKAKSFDSLNDQELAVLTGLADFQASLVETATMPNPMPSKKTTEIDFFSYQIAQQTTISDVKTREMRERSITQAQSSKLKASYHEPPKPGAPLFPPPIDGRQHPDEQSYYYYQLVDQASSVATILRRGTAAWPIESGAADSGFYAKDEILKADVTKTASQSTHMMHFDRDILVEDVTTPASNSRILDLLSSLVQPPSHRLMTSAEEIQQQGMLASTLDQVLLQDDPVKI